MCIANLCLNKFILLLLLLLPKDQSTVQFRFGTKLIKYCKCIIIDVGFAIDKNGNFEKKIRLCMCEQASRAVMCKMINNKGIPLKYFSFQFAIPTTKLINEGKRFEPPRPGWALVGNEA